MYVYPHIRCSPSNKREKEKEKENSRKSVRWSAVPVAPVFVYVSVMVRGAAAPKGPMTYAQKVMKLEAGI